MNDSSTRKGADRVTSTVSARRKGTLDKPSFHPQYTPDASQNQGPAPAHGRVKGDTWQKTARASVHMMRIPKGWAVDVSDLDVAEHIGLRLLHIHDLEGLEHFWALLSIVREHGFKVSRGCGPQWALGIEHWRPTRQEAEALASDKPKDDGGPTQLGLWAA